MQTAFVPEDLLCYPRCGGAADNQHKIVLRASPVIPEMFDRHDQITSIGVHERQLINEHDLASIHL